MSQKPFATRFRIGSDGVESNEGKVFDPYGEGRAVRCPLRLVDDGRVIQMQPKF